MITNNMRKCRIKRYFQISMALILVAIAVPALALLSDFRPSTELVSTWFQRSGSIVVLLAVLIEFNIFKAKSELDFKGLIDNEIPDLHKKFDKKVCLYSCLGVIIAITGTVIWGYGDILYLAFAVES